VRHSRAVVGVAAVAVIALGVAAAVLLTRPVGLPSRALESVPALLSEPAGILGAGITLAPDGLGAVQFGADEASTVEILTDLLGAPVEEGPQPCDSQADTVHFVQWGNLSVSFPDGRFSGWIIGVYVPPDRPQLRVETPEGIEVGASRDELLAHYGDRVSFVGHEDSGFGDPVEVFGIDGYSPDEQTPTGIGGFVELDGEESRVITLIAGQPCGLSGS
jgi:hypothetical protein